LDEAFAFFVMRDYDKISTKEKEEEGTGGKQNGRYNGVFP